MPCVIGSARIALQASRPFITGITISISTRSGFSSRARSHASAPFDAVMIWKRSGARIIRSIIKTV